MKYRFFYVPNTLATLRELTDASIPEGQARMMLGKTFEIQFATPAAEAALRGAKGSLEKNYPGSLENYPDYGVSSWTVPLSAVELRFTGGAS